MEIAQTISKTLPHPRYRLPFAGDIVGLDTAKPVQKEMAMATELGGIYERKIFGHCHMGKQSVRLKHHADISICGG